MAQLFSGEKKKLEEEEAFKNFYLRVKNSTKVVPNLNEITHGDSFCCDDYNGYDLSYLAVRYLSENLSFASFQNLLSDFSQIKVIGNHILDEMFAYYDKKYLTSKMR